MLTLSKQSGSLEGIEPVRTDDLRARVRCAGRDDWDTKRSGGSIGPIVRAISLTGIWNASRTNPKMELVSASVSAVGARLRKPKSNSYNLGDTSERAHAAATHRTRRAASRSRCRLLAFSPYARHNATADASSTPRQKVPPPCAKHFVPARTRPVHAYARASGRAHAGPFPAELSSLGVRGTGGGRAGRAAGVGSPPCCTGRPAAGPRQPRARA